MAPQPDERPTREPIDTLLRDLKTGRDGLGSREAARRLAIHGPNTLPTGRRASWVRELVRQFTHPLALLLWVAAGLAWVAGTPVLCWAILAVIVINAIVAYLQGRQAERAIEALSRYLPQQATVIRDGVASEVPAVDLVPGDVILVTEGDRVSADARLIEGSVEMDLSTLTGESAPVARSAGAEDTADRLIDAPDAVFSGAQCTSGQARAVAFATGATTELGRIATLSRQATPLLSPLERQVRRSTWLIAGVAVGVGALFLPLGLLAGLSLPEAAVFAIGLLVANVPEGLLPTITLALAVGVRVLARQGALVKQLSAVETLGSTTVICTDKTGTLTRNTMTVTAVWSAGRTVEPASSDAALGPLAEVMVDCNQLERLSDPMEAALREAGEQLGARVAPRVATFPFDAERKRMSVVSRRGDRLLVAVKGAPELVLPLCVSVFDGTRARPATDSDRREVLDAVDGFARHGLRVLGLASREVAAPPEDATAAESGLCLVGLVALLDPPRPEVPEAVAACHSAGITIHVVTGDNGTTASEVARQVGIATNRVITGSEADALSEPELDALLAQPGEFVFARSTPEGKLRIAEALQQEGQTVAMTGDGVNDAPALHRADIGVAMGRSGTDVARQAATMVLTDDNFATIVTAIREGRRAYDNLRKFVLYIFVHAVPEVVPFMLFALSGGAIPLPLTVLQILAIDLGTEILPALALGREKAEPDVMSRRPRPRSEPLITRRLLLRAWGLMGVLSAALALGAFFAVLVAGGWTPGAPVGPGDPLHGVYLQATTATFLTIVACQVGTAFAARTERTSLRRLGVLSNPPLLAAIGVELLFAAALCFVPVLQTVFGTAPPPWWLVLLLVPCPVIVWGADEAARWFGRRRADRSTAGSRPPEVRTAGAATRPSAPAGVRPARAPSRPRRPSSG